MGKLIKFLTLIIMVDLLFVITGQAPDSLTSIIFSTLLDIGNVSTSELMTTFIGNIFTSTSSATGVLALVASIATVAVGVVFSRSESLLFASFAVPLGLLANDLVFIASYLIGLNAILGTLIMGPIIILYVFTILEWIRGKD